MTKRLIGWREWVALPSLGIDQVKVKVDTGARTSSLHAFDLEIKEGKLGLSTVYFNVCPFQRDSRTTIPCKAPLRELRWVTSSNGKRERRPVIVTDLSLFDRRWPIELTLTSRDELGFRMLLGRQAIRGSFIVDAGRSYLAGAEHGISRKKKKRKKT